MSVPWGTINTVTGHPIFIIQICFKDLNLYICKQCGVLAYFVHYFWLFCSAVQAVGQISSLFNPFLGPYMAFTYYPGVPHDHILYLLTFCFLVSEVCKWKTVIIRQLDKEI